MANENDEQNSVPTDDQENIETSATNDDAGQEEQDNEQPPADDASGVEEDKDTKFDLKYVEKLRKEAGDNRVKAKEQEETIDKLKRRLFLNEVKGLGKLADPTDLPYDAELVDDPDKLKEAVDDLLARKPHLGRRVPNGDAGLGVGSEHSSGVDILGMMRNNV